VYGGGPNRSTDAESPRVSRRLQDWENGSHGTPGPTTEDKARIKDLAQSRLKRPTIAQQPRYRMAYLIRSVCLSELFDDMKAGFFDNATFTNVSTGEVWQDSVG
jgi:hypothetical protein